MPTILASISETTPKGCAAREYTTMRELILRISNPYFVAGVVYDERLNPIAAAPIVRWMLDKTHNDIVKWLNSRRCKQKGWSYEQKWIS